MVVGLEIATLYRWEYVAEKLRNGVLPHVVLVHYGLINARGDSHQQVFRGHGCRHVGKLANNGLNAGFIGGYVSTEPLHHVLHFNEVVDGDFPRHVFADNKRA